MSQFRIVLSHTSANTPFANELAWALRAAGSVVWYVEHTLGACVLCDEIMQELAARPVFAVVLSKAAFA